jgi:anti-sigma regulatory factor (Ser/Thr protein kinase)
MVHDWESLSKEALILSPDYIKLPYVNLEDIVVKEYPVLDGASDVIPLHDRVYDDLIKDGLGEKCAGGFAFVVLEAAENAQEHGYKKKSHDTEGNLNAVYTGGIFTPKYDIIGISSKGNIDIEKIRTLIAENETLRFGKRGRGFFFMTKLCDVVYPHQNDEYMEVMLIMMKDKFYEKC